MPGRFAACLRLPRDPNASSSSSSLSSSSSSSLLSLASRKDGAAAARLSEQSVALLFAAVAGRIPPEAPFLDEGGLGLTAAAREQRVGGGFAFATGVRSLALLTAVAGVCDLVDVHIPPTVEVLLLLPSLPPSLVLLLLLLLAALAVLSFIFAGATFVPVALPDALAPFLLVKLAAPISRAFAAGALVPARLLPLVPRPLRRDALTRALQHQSRSSGAKSRHMPSSTVDTRMTLGTRDPPSISNCTENGSAPPLMAPMPVVAFAAAQRGHSWNTSVPSKLASAFSFASSTEPSAGADQSDGTNPPVSSLSGLSAKLCVRSTGIGSGHTREEVSIQATSSRSKPSAFAFANTGESLGTRMCIEAVSTRFCRTLLAHTESERAHTHGGCTRGPAHRAHIAP